MDQDQDASLGAFIVRVSKTRNRRRPGTQAVIKGLYSYILPSKLSSKFYIYYAFEAISQLVVLPR